MSGADSPDRDSDAPSDDQYSSLPDSSSTGTTDTETRSDDFITPAPHADAPSSRSTESEDAAESDDLVTPAPHADAPSSGSNEAGLKETKEVKQRAKK